MVSPRIETLPLTKLIGQNITMSFSNDRTVELWRGFSPQRKEIKNTVGRHLYSVEIYPNTSFFRKFDPTQEFQKWAAVAIGHFDQIPDNMETLVIPEGTYAVFHYRGKPSDAMPTFRYIYGKWLPNSAYEMDDRPYFALMGEKYKGEHPESEEEFWVPIRKK